MGHPAAGSGSASQQVLQPLVCGLVDAAHGSTLPGPTTPGRPAAAAAATEAQVQLAQGLLAVLMEVAMAEEVRVAATGGAARCSRRAAPPAAAASQAVPDKGL